MLVLMGSFACHGFFLCLCGFAAALFHLRFPITYPSSTTCCRKTPVKYCGGNFYTHELYLWCLSLVLLWSFFGLSLVFFFGISKKKCNFAPNFKKIVHMAKNVGLIGGVKGKLGNAVFYVRRGKTLSRVYQPEVANPKSLSQVEQRAKFALAGRLMKITPIAALEGIAGDRQFKRNEFVRRVIAAETYANNKASLVASQLSLSDGTVVLRTTNTFVVDLHSTYVDVTVSTARAGAQALPVGYGQRVVVYALDSTEKATDYCVTSVMTMPEDAETKTTLLRMTLPQGSQANYQFLVYVIPFQVSEVLSNVKYSFLGAEGNGSTIVLVDDVESRVNLGYGQAQLVAMSQ